MRFTEEQLKNMGKPASISEEEQINRTIRMIKEAVNNIILFDKDRIEVFVQGSYANKTNIKCDSDVDINIMLKHCYTFNSHQEKDTLNDLKGAFEVERYRDHILSVLNKKFGVDNISKGNKSLIIKNNTCRVNADVVPSFQYIDNFGRRGVIILSRNNSKIVNYPEQHIKNGKSKNKDTEKRYKTAVRILKKLKQKMDEESYSNPKISSFLIECLVWNVDNEHFIVEENWNLRLKKISEEIHRNIKTRTDMKEVSNVLPLFDEVRKWKESDVIEFLDDLQYFMGWSND